MHTVERFFVIGRSLLLFTHTCPVTEFAVASHLNTMLQLAFFQYLSYSQRHPSVRFVCFFLIGTVLMFHPGPAALSIYKQNLRNAPLYSALFPLDLLGFRTKKLYSVTKTQIL